MSIKDSIARVASSQAFPRPEDSILPVDPSLTLHVDGDYAAYYCSGGDDTQPGLARLALINKIEAARVACGASKVVVHLSMPGCCKAWRYLIATIKPYQGQRGGRKPVNWQFLRDYMESYTGPMFKVAKWRSREADDGLALVSVRSRAAILTADKDMRMLAGLHVDWHSHICTEVPPGTYDLTRKHDGLQYGTKWFWLQMLQGDSADNIPGLPKLDGKQCGEKRAQQYLSGITTAEDAYEMVAAAYYRHYKDEWADRFVEQAGLLWLRTDEEASIMNILAAFPEELDDPQVTEAVYALDTRVRKERAEIDAIQAGAGS